MAVGGLCPPSQSFSNPLKNSQIYRTEDRGGILQHHTLYRRGSASAPGFTLLRRGKQEKGCPIIELGQGRRGSLGRCRDYQEASCTGTQNGIFLRGFSNFRHGTRGTSQMTVPAGLSYFQSKVHTNHDTIPIHYHACHTIPSCWDIFFQRGMFEFHCICPDYNTKLPL